MVECFIVVDVGSSSGSSHDVFLADFTVDLCHLSSCCCVLQQLVVLLQVVDFFSFEEFLSTFNGLFSQFVEPSAKIHTKMKQPYSAINNEKHALGLQPQLSG